MVGRVKAVWRFGGEAMRVVAFWRLGGRLENWEHFGDLWVGL